MTNMERAHEHYLNGVPTSIDIPNTTVERMLIDAVADYPNRVAIDFWDANGLTNRSPPMLNARSLY